MKKAYLLDEGVLLTKEDEEFESYATVYDKKYGYFDESQSYVKSKKKAIEYAKNYAREGVENTYAIVSITVLSDDFDFEDGHVEDESYLIEDVIYSVARINGKIVENFLKQ